MPPSWVVGPKRAQHREARPVQADLEDGAAVARAAVISQAKERPADGSEESKGWHSLGCVSREQMQDDVAGAVAAEPEDRAVVRGATMWGHAVEHATGQCQGACRVVAIGPAGEGVEQCVARAIRRDLEDGARIPGPAIGCHSVQPAPVEDRDPCGELPSAEPPRKSGGLKACAVEADLEDRALA